jgi:kanamycin kinase/aminoglycoside 3'-phosphotransferase-3
MKRLELPGSIAKRIENKPYTIDEIGMSGNQVLIFEDMVLKIEDDVEAATAQVELLRWLEGKLSVPRVLTHEVTEEKSYLLMSKVDGVMSCDTYYLEHPDILLDALVCGLKQLWQVDISNCGQSRDLDIVLGEARKCVENHMVDVENVEPETFGENGFQDPDALLEWLETHRPEVETVFSHGDFCLPNIFLKDGAVAGFIDMGRAGIADKWCDIALCYRSLKHNFAGRYGGKVYKDFNPDLLFEKLGIEPDWEKLRYYTLLDELF